MSDPRHPLADWSDERVDLLKGLRADGLSASLIAKALGGVSRSAVIGKLHRLGIRDNKPSKPTTFKPYPERKAATARRPRAPDGFTYGVAQPKQQYQERPQPTVGPIDSPNAKVWTERRRFECAYIVDGEGADAIACCNPACHKSSWCRDHHSVVFLPGSRVAPSRIKASIYRIQEFQRGGTTFEEWAAA